MSNNNKVVYKDVMIASLINLASLLVNFVILIVTAIITMSISIYMNLMKSTCNILRTGTCVFLSSRLQKNQSFKYNYGTDNLETVAMLLCEALLTMSCGALMIFAITRLFEPIQPSDTLIMAVIVKTVNIVVGGLILLKCYKTYKNTGTKIAKTNFEGTLGSFYFDLGIFVSVVSSYLFKGYAFTAYIEPIFSIIMAVLVISKSISRIKKYIKDLTYITLDEEDQMKIMKVLANHFHDFDKFFSVNSHKSGKNVYIDFLVSFPLDTTYGDIVDSLNAMTKELEDIFDDCKVSFIFDNNTLPS